MSLSTDCLLAGHKNLLERVPDMRDQLPKLEPRKTKRPSNNLPVPETPSLPPPPNITSLKFKKPSRRILSSKDHEFFLKSPTYDLLLGFVFGLADSVVDIPISSVKETDVSHILEKINGVLDQVKELVEKAPPVDQGDSRFGNRGFRDFLDHCVKAQQSWHNQLGITDLEAVDEVSAYFLQSFGNRTRLDYGSGHELNFILWLLCLYQLGLITPADFRSLTLVVFIRYLELMRFIQSTYYLEPAGSHGVWGLDDFQFLPFLFGSSQLLHHPYIRPLSIHQDFILEEYSKDFLYLGQVSFINKVKNVEGLRWHSPMLDDISSAKSWAKVEAGMRRMFVAEIMKKLPVMQHFLFGSLIPAVEGMTTEDDPTTGSDEDEKKNRDAAEMDDCTKHTHHLETWGCCGIKVPSSVAAAQEIKKRANGNGQRLRRIPFD
ncbi:Serine/threonine-protein phosphatase 2A activator 2 [Golovinomyces cichoracearum]|uniref:Serine/threonine-protein phosphatase 2A activator n=1 Tax=Golovinomyces cichoracearum TaxID=62708 RepID=A0A420IZT3_9PEZI|nr:Serine/threonine-protein phosphatase 2A activator 2 [Golovinomyces cichoracearum]